MVLALAVTFSSGWLAAKVQDVNKVDPAQIWVNQWVGNLVTLVDQHGDKTRFIPPEQVRSLVLWGVDINSGVLGKIFDDLPEHLRQQVMFYLPAARSLARAPAWPKAKTDKRDLSILVECLEKAQSGGGKVEPCYKRKRYGNKPGAKPD